MHGRNVFLAAIMLLAGFAIGFFVANSLNRGEVDELRRQLEQLKTRTESQSKDRDAALSEEEIRAKIAEADANPDDVGFQTNLGIALYRYGSMKRDAALIREAGRLLDRANSLEANNFDVLAGLGSVNFDLGYIAGENDKFAASRGFYQKASNLRPSDSSIRTNIGLTYFLSKPPEIESALLSFEDSLKVNPNDERALEYIVRSLASLNRESEARGFFERLRAVNSANPALDELQALLGSKTEKR